MGPHGGVPGGSAGRDPEAGTAGRPRPEGVGVEIKDLLGDEALPLLTYESTGITREQLTLPGPDFVDRALVASDRPPAVLRNLQSVFDTGRLGGTGYLSILPVDQGVEHSAAA